MGRTRGNIFLPSCFFGANSLRSPAIQYGAVHVRVDIYLYTLLLVASHCGNIIPRTFSPPPPCVNRSTLNMDEEVRWDILSRIHAPLDPKAACCEKPTTAFQGHGNSEDSQEQTV